MVDWIFTGERRFDEPFFEDTMQNLLHQPFHAAFRRGTSMDPLTQWAGESPGIAPTGLIFHMSRCGSTLLCRLLGASPANIVLSECSPLDAALRAFPGRVSDSDRVSWLRALVSALAQPSRHAHAQHLFIKFDCWNIAHLPLIRHAFPETPWIFLYRDPLEVLLSHLHIPAAWTVPAEFPPSILGLNAEHVECLPRDEYCATILAQLCHLAASGIASYAGRAVPYSDLAHFSEPGSSCSFGLQFSPGEQTVNSQTASENSKAPGQAFIPGASAKYALCNDRIRRLSAHLITPAIDKLETLHAERI